MATSKQQPSLLGIAPELRHLIYKDILADVRVYHIKTRLIEFKHLRPAFEQWLIPVHETGITSLCRQITTELSTQMLHEALADPESKIIVKIQNFDFRPLQRFIKSLGEAQKARFNSSPSKLVVLLHFNDIAALNVKKLESWLEFRKEFDVALTHHVAEGDRLTLLPYMREIYAASSGEEEMWKIYEAVVIWNADPIAIERRIRRLYGGGTRSGGSVAHGVGLASLVGGG